MSVFLDGTLCGTAITNGVDNISEMASIINTAG
jgi:hypothetical protein